MISPRRIASNRRNAQQSTGPRTREGKDRSARNARRHGLATDISFDPDFGPQAEALACAIAGPRRTDPWVMQAARLVALDELDLMRIRQIRSGLLAKLVQALDTAGEAAEPHSMDLVRTALRAGLRGQKDIIGFVRVQQQAHAIARMSAILMELLAIERYERRAMSRRKRILRKLETLRE